MSRFFVNKENIKDNTIHIVGEDVNHIKNVLRYHEGQSVTVCDGDKIDYNCVINKISKSDVELKILGKQECNTEPRIKITLFQGVPKKDKMELIIQKSVELGVVEIVPVLTERVIVQFKDQKKEKNKLERWSKIVESAAKQSKRGIIPNINPVISFDEAIKKSKKLDRALIAYENEVVPLKEQLEQFKEDITIGIFIGPEGGFTEEEVTKALDNNIKSVSLGNRILRTETAGIALISAIMYAYGEM